MSEQQDDSGRLAEVLDSLYDGNHDLLDNIADELDNAATRFPLWPTDLVYAAGILVEEAAETLQAALNGFNGKTGAGETRRLVRAEAIQTAAMALRLLANLEE